MLIYINYWSIKIKSGYILCKSKAELFAPVWAQNNSNDYVHYITLYSN